MKFRFDPSLVFLSTASLIDMSDSWHVTREFIGSTKMCQMVKCTLTLSDSVCDDKLWLVLVLSTNNVLIVKRLGLGLGLGLGWKMENGKWKIENGKWKMENGKWNMENRKYPQPRRWQYNRTGHPPPITFNHEGALWQQSAFSKNVLGWSPKPNQQKNYQVDSNNNNLWESNMFKEKVINNP